MRPSCLALLALSACAGPALECRRGDEVCAKVRQNLETTRGNAGRKCATPTMGAYVRLRDMGDSAAPYLVQALADPQWAVAWQAATVLVNTGHGDDLTRWCEDGDGPQHGRVCSPWLAYVTKLGATP